MCIIIDDLYRETEINLESYLKWFTKEFKHRFDKFSNGNWIFGNEATVKNFYILGEQLVFDWGKNGNE